MNLEKLSYEEAHELLEKNIEKLEQNDISLDETLRVYKESMDLYNRLREILEKAEGEIKLVLEKDGELTQEDFLYGVKENEDDFY